MKRKRKSKQKPQTKNVNTWYEKRERWLNYWYQHPLFFIGLWPFAKLYQFFFFIRHHLYRLNWLKKYRAPIPVIVVGNLVVGGTGKSVCIMALANFLQEQGYRVAIITRGYGGKVKGPVIVKTDSDPAQVGDEPVMIAKKTDCLVVKDVKRARAAQYVVENSPSNVILSDDGLQHAALARDIEIVMYHHPKIKNMACLPQGPFRESVSRYRRVDFVLGDDIPSDLPAYRIVRKITGLRALKNGEHRLHAPQDFFGQTVHAVCAIAHPDRLFTLLREQGINIIPHPFPDHYFFKEKDFDFSDRLPIIITEKDAVKCQTLNIKNCYVVELDATLPLPFEEALLKVVEMRSTSPCHPAGVASIDCES